MRFLLLGFGLLVASPSPPASEAAAPDPIPLRWWKCESKRQDKPVKGRVCARHEPDAVMFCGDLICELDMVCQGQCICVPTQDACAPAIE